MGHLGGVVGALRGHRVEAGDGVAEAEDDAAGGERGDGMADDATGDKRLDTNHRIRCQIVYTCAEYLQPEKTDPRKLAQMQTSGTLRDFVINDSKFMKLREVSLSYEAPESFAARARAKQAGFTLAARNLHTWTPYTGLDPESEFVSGGTVNVDQAHVPQLMSLVLTVRLSY